jgi:flavin reductase (DIM6/NTAB) family NADH-FMN oxidoreductase RutF
MFFLYDVNLEFHRSYDLSNDSFTKLPKHPQYIELTSLQSISRLLYPSPVCFLTSQSSSYPLNVMAVSWLMPTNNYAGFAMTIHKTRHTATILSESSNFILSVATALQRELLLQIGKTSGKHVDKFDGHIPELTTCRLGQWDEERYSHPLPEDWKNKSLNELKVIRPKLVRGSIIAQTSSSNKYSILDDHDDDDNSETSSSTSDNSQSISSSSSSDNQGEGKPMKEATPAKLLAIIHTAAHLQCHVISIQDSVDPGHHLILAQVDQAYVHPSYWSNRGHCFVSQANYPPLLKFLGSQCFGYIHASGVEFPID